MRFDDLKNVRVAILGMGREGQAVWRQIRLHFPDKHLSLFVATDIGDDLAIETLYVQFVLLVDIDGGDACGACNELFQRALGTNVLGTQAQTAGNNPECVVIKMERLFAYCLNRSVRKAGG